MRLTKFIVAGALLMAFSPELFAGQNYTVGFSDDVTTGATGPYIAGVVLSNNRYAGNVGSYPSVNLGARGRRANFQSSYSFGFNKYFFGSSDRTNSHVATTAFSSGLGPNWNFQLSDSFEQTTNNATFKLLRGDTTVPTDFQFNFDPLNAGTRRTYSANVGLGRKLSERAALNFSGSVSVLKYLNNTQFIGVLTDQQREFVSVGYSHSLPRGNWSLVFSGTQFAFSAFHNAQSYAVVAGYARQLSKSLTLNVTGGPSHVQSPEVLDHRQGINASIGLQRAVKAGSFSVSFSHMAGGSTGLGTISNNSQGTFGFTHTLSRRTSLSIDTAVVDTRGLTVDTQNTLGISAGGAVNFAIARMWSMNWGAQVQRYTGNALFAQDQRRIFISLRFRNPELWRFQR